MNQRIKELALEAGGSHYPDINTKQLERFAELIVRECMSLTERCLDGNDVFALNGAEIIAEHFGVEL